jgi:hypothetical protein
MMTNESDSKQDTIIDLDADQVIDHDSVKTKVAPPSAKRSKYRVYYAGAALLATAIGGGWFYKDVLSNYLPSDHVQAMAEKIVTLEKSNATLREQLNTVDKLAIQLTSDMDALEGKEQKLASLAEEFQKSATTNTGKLLSLEKTYAETKKSLEELAFRPVADSSGSVDLSVLQQRLADLEKDVASLKVKPAEPVDNTAALSQNLSDLKAKIAAGTSFRDEYDRVQRMVPAAAGLDVLEQHAALGLPDAKGLAFELKGIISELPKPDLPVAASDTESWWDSVSRSLSDLITIKVEGEADWPNTAAAAVAFAEAGDLPQAFEHLSAVEATKPVGVQQWLDRAAARISVEKALQSVEEAVLRVIAAKG